MGNGSLYDLVVAEIVAGGDDKDAGARADEPDADVELAVQMLLDLRKRRRFTREVERAFAAVDRESPPHPRARRRRASR
jgi:hypothetical protein